MPVGWFSGCCTDPVENTLGATTELPQSHREKIWQQMGSRSSHPFLSQKKGSLRLIETTVSSMCMTEIMVALAQHWPLARLHGGCLMSCWNGTCGWSKRCSSQQDHCPFLEQDIGLFLVGTRRRKVCVTLRRAHLAKRKSLKPYIKRGLVRHCVLGPQAS